MSNFAERFDVYERAGVRTGRNLEIEAFAFDSEGFTPQTLEKAVRQYLIDKGHDLPWDNTPYEGTGRLGRPGPGVPGAPIPRRIRNQVEWDTANEELVPIKK